MYGIKYPEEQMHRIKYIKLTKDQIDEKLIATSSGPECKSEYSDILAGKSLKIVTDNGPALSYTFGENPPMTEEKVHRAIQKNTSIFPEGGAMAGNRLPLSDFLDLHACLQHTSFPFMDHIHG